MKKSAFLRMLFLPFLVISFLVISISCEDIDDPDSVKELNRETRYRFKRSCTGSYHVRCLEEKDEVKQDNIIGWGTGFWRGAARSAASFHIHHCFLEWAGKDLWEDELGECASVDGVHKTWKSMVKEVLKTHPNCQYFESYHLQPGGQGCTGWTEDLPDNKHVRNIDGKEIKM